MKCLVCRDDFKGRLDAKTCSPKCRKTLSRRVTHNRQNVTDNVTDNISVTKPTIEVEIIPTKDWN